MLTYQMRAALAGEVKLHQGVMNLLREGKREEHHRLPKLQWLVDGLPGKLDDSLGYGGGSDIIFF